jgi:hypothetical protein
MDQIILAFAFVYLLTLAAVVGGIKRGHAPDTMGIAAFLLGPFSLLMLLSDQRQRCQQCNNRTLKTNEFCPHCGLQLVQEAVYWRAQRMRQEQAQRMGQVPPRLLKRRDHARKNLPRPARSWPG